MLPASNFEQRLGAIDIHLAQQLLIPIQHGRRRRMDNHSRLDGTEHVQHRLDGGDIAIVVLRTRETVVGRAQINHRHLGNTLRVSFVQSRDLEARVVLNLGQCRAGIFLRREVQEVVDDMPAHESAASHHEYVTQF